MTYEQINKLREALRTVYEVTEGYGVSETLDLACRELETRIPGAELYLEDLHPDMDPLGSGPLLPISASLRSQVETEDRTLLDWFHDDQVDFTRVSTPGLSVQLDPQGYGREVPAGAEDLLKVLEVLAILSRAVGEGDAAPSAPAVESGPAEQPKNLDLRVGTIVRALKMLDPEGACVLANQVGVVMGEANCYGDGNGPMVRWLESIAYVSPATACNVYPGDVEVVSYPELPAETSESK